MAFRLVELKETEGESQHEICIECLQLFLKEDIEDHSCTPVKFGEVYRDDGMSISFQF